MQCTSYFSSPSEQTLLDLHVREAALRVAREELEFLRLCGGVAADDVRRLKQGLGLPVSSSSSDEVVVMDEEDDDVVVVKEEGEDVVSLRSVLIPALASGASIAQLCRRVRPVLEREGVMLLKRKKILHINRRDSDRVLAIGRGVAG